MRGSEAKNVEEITADSDMPSDLTAKQELALQAVISHATLKEAAHVAGIGETTLWRYMKEKAFARRLSEARRGAVSHAAIRLQQGSSDAVSVLQQLMMKDDAPAAARISAARTVLDYSMRAVEQDDLRARLDALDQFILIKQEEDALDRAAKENPEGEEQ